MEEKEFLTLVSLDTKALDGLRGLASLHIMVYHVLLLSRTGINTYGQVMTSSIMISFASTKRRSPYACTLPMPCWHNLRYMCHCSSCSLGFASPFDTAIIRNTRTYAKKAVSPVPQCPHGQRRIALIPSTIKSFGMHGQSKFCLSTTQHLHLPSSWCCWEMNRKRGRMMMWTWRFGGHLLPFMGCNLGS